MKVIELESSVTASNDRDAKRLRGRLRREGILLVNVMSSPGAGKTTLLSRLVRDLSRRGLRLGVMEADIASEVDAERMEAAGAKAIQAHTGGMCHMDAGMTARALDALDARGLDIIFLENVGNLICPAEYDTGATLDLMILSVPEGDDKPLKYPLIFSRAGVLVISKTDALPYFSFDTDLCTARARRLNPDLRVFPLSARTGEGMDALEEYLLKALRRWRGEDSGSMAEGKEKKAAEESLRRGEVSPHA
ncbi:MAG: hydrogenase nickel incorporation protein HypB [Lachnospiraceae bacterium]|nr:hydrogenase nickel incorporation protein HypB [Lachnospiraceae bacterium]